MKNLVVDRDHFERFTTRVMQSLKDSERWFVSLSARNKYLTAEEREYFQLGRTEMFGRTLGGHDWDYTMRKLAANLEYRRTKSGLEYPEKAVVVYVNVNPSDSVKACAMFAAEVLRMQTEMTNSFVAGNQPNVSVMNRGDRLLLDCFQKATGTRHYVDLDVDAPVEFATELTTALNDHNVVHHLVKTKGGHHVLVNRESLNGSKCRLHEVVKQLHQEAVKFGGEVLFNSNAMVAMPGTLQGGVLVELVY